MGPPPLAPFHGGPETARDMGTRSVPAAERGDMTGRGDGPDLICRKKYLLDIDTSSGAELVFKPDCAIGCENQRIIPFNRNDNIGVGEAPQIQRVITGVWRIGQDDKVARRKDDPIIATGGRELIQTTACCEYLSCGITDHHVGSAGAMLLRQYACRPVRLRDTPQHDCAITTGPKGHGPIMIKHPPCAGDGVWTHRLASEDNRVMRRVKSRDP